MTLKAKRPREAEAHYRALLSIPGVESAGHVGLGDVARAEERYADAVVAYRAALAIDPMQSAPARALAWSLMRAAATTRRSRRTTTILRSCPAIAKCSRRAPIC